MNVKNRACIRRLSWKTLKASKTRNLIAISAIALTTMLFTAIFTIGFSMNKAYQDSNFRQCGGFSHGTFKYLTKEQFDDLKCDESISQWGMRRFLGSPTEAPFQKNYVEIGYSDENQAHWMFCDPVEGRLPKEGTQEAATDTKVLELLGVEPKLGTEFTITFEVEQQMTTQTFTLCGWWESDEAIAVSHVLLPESRVNDILAECEIVPDGLEERTGSYNLDVMFSNSWNLENKMNDILEKRGLQGERRDQEGYVSIGVNWAYTSSQIFRNADAFSVLAIAALFGVVIFTGYLIIFNVFQISVTNDIRFYGLLRTIGTTGRQMKRIVRMQAWLLALVGIPIGFVIGYITGVLLIPKVAIQMDGLHMEAAAVSPFIFVFSAVFSLVTIFLSCHKPARKAAGVSPIEAIRTTEGDSVKKKKKRRHRVSTLSMAFSNIGRNRMKTVVVIASLSCSVILLNFTMIFSGGFDLDKYVKYFSTTDFVVANARYFNTAIGGLFWEGREVSEDDVKVIEANEGITDNCRIYGQTSEIEEIITEDNFRKIWGRYDSNEVVQSMIDSAEHLGDGRLTNIVQLYGMEDYALEQLQLIEGDIEALKKETSRSIAAVYRGDDYGNPQWDSGWAKLGETVTLRYIEEMEYYNLDTGEVYESIEDIGEEDLWGSRAKKYKDIDYTVDAVVTVPRSLSYRYSGTSEYVLNARNFINATGTDSVMLYAFNTTEQANEDMENFLSDYIENGNPELNYESKQQFKDEFENFRGAFLLMGSVLSLIVGIVGVLNFFNTILTGIISRKHEFAILQSIGMTTKQLKKMLIQEGLMYTLGAGAFVLILLVLLGPVIGTMLEGMFWFFTYRPNYTAMWIMLPIFLIMGIVLPTVSYHFAVKKTLVERLREH